MKELFEELLIIFFGLGLCVLIVVIVVAIIIIFAFYIGSKFFNV